MEIRSVQNPKIKNLLKLQQKSKIRKQEGLFVVEGIQENELAMEAGYTSTSFFIYPTYFNKKITIPTNQTIEISKEVFKKIAYRETTGGIVGVYKTQNTQIENIPTTQNPYFIVLEAVEKPGNLGAILRTADAVNATAVVVCDPKVDFYNPNVIRSSVGTLFTNNLVATTKEEWVHYCQKNNIQVAATFLRKDTRNLFDLDFKMGTSIIFGTEATGLSNFWAQNSNVTLSIPMCGKVDSLNLSNAVAVCSYEVFRQRS